MEKLPHAGERTPGPVRAKGANDAMAKVSRFLQNDNAATAVEYAVMLGLITLAMVASIGLLGDKMLGAWNTIVSALTPAGS